MLPSNYECEGQMTIFEYIHQSQFGKTSLELYPQEPQKEQTSDAYLKNWQESKTPKFQYLCLRNGDMRDISTFLMDLSHGEPTTLVCGESPNPVVESHLSSILEKNPDPKYNLSPLACQGILRRAKKANKPLPELLEKVLIQQSVSKNEPVNLGGQRNPHSARSNRNNVNPQQSSRYVSGGDKYMMQ